MNTPALRNERASTVAAESLLSLLAGLRSHVGIAQKQDIADVLQALGRHGFAAAEAAIGDDCAVIPRHDGRHLLFAIEGFINAFVAHDAWFAGWCGVLSFQSGPAAASRHS